MREVRPARSGRMGEGCAGTTASRREAVPDRGAGRARRSGCAGAAVGIDAGGARAEVAIAVGGNARRVAGSRGVRAGLALPASGSRDCSLARALRRGARPRRARACAAGHACGDRAGGPAGGRRRDAAAGRGRAARASRCCVLLSAAELRPARARRSPPRSSPRSWRRHRPLPAAPDPGDAEDDLHRDATAPGARSTRRSGSRCWRSRTATASTSKARARARSPARPAMSSSIRNGTIC